MRIGARRVAYAFAQSCLRKGPKSRRPAYAPTQTCLRPHAELPTQTWHKSRTHQRNSAPHISLTNISSDREFKHLHIGPKKVSKSCFLKKRHFGRAETTTWHGRADRKPPQVPPVTISQPRCIPEGRKEAIEKEQKPNSEVSRSRGVASNRPGRGPKQRDQSKRAFR